MPQCLTSRAITFVFVLAALSGCSGMGDTNIGGRPLVYKNTPTDEVVIKAGIVRKKSEVEAEEAMQAEDERAARAAARKSSAAPEREPSLAQAQPARRAPERVAAVPNAEFASRYTQASRYGDLLFVSGQIAADPRSGNFESGMDIGQQTDRALQNVQAILEANRLTMANIVSATVYVTNISRLSTVDAVYHDFFRGNPPARTVVEVSNLPRGALVEISVVAGR